MPHQNVDAAEGAAQNAATDKTAPNDPGREQNAAVRREPSSYAASEWTDATLAPPAAGEVSDYMDEGDALAADDVQQGSTNRNRSQDTEAAIDRGPETRKGDQSIRESGSAD